MDIRTEVGPNVDVFWGEIPPCEHLVQIYEEDAAFLDTLVGFASGGLRHGDAVIVIATPLHLDSLEDRLEASDIDLKTARSENRYIPLDAEATLSKFVVDGWPDDVRFDETIEGILLQARSNGRHVRAFGEMVALLWANGHNAATVRLEYLWHRLCQREAFSLFCAYPRIGFTQDMSSSIEEICAAHTKVIANNYH